MQSSSVAELPFWLASLARQPILSLQEHQFLACASEELQWLTAFGQCPFH